MTYQELMGDLTDAWRLTDAPEEAQSDDGHWVHMAFETGQVCVN